MKLIKNKIINIEKNYFKIAGLVLIMVFALFLTSCAKEEKEEIEGITFEDKTVHFDGTLMSIGITGELPENIVVSYVNNHQSEVGTYTVVAQFKDLENPERLFKNLTAKLTIIPSEEILLIGITFSDKTFTYDGLEKSLTIVGNLPENVTVSYTNNNQVNAGTYTVVAHFVDTVNTDREPKELTATLTIQPRRVNVSFEDQEFTYDGENKSIEITGELPAGVSVEYENNNHSEVGSYRVRAKFTNNNPNYLPLNDITANLIIFGMKFDIEFNNEIHFYDGTEKQLSPIVGKLPEGISVEYSENKLTDAGILEVVATFSGPNIETYEISRSAYLIVYSEDLVITEEMIPIIRRVKNIFFGKYPQTIVDDENLISALNLLQTTNADGYYEHEGYEYAKVVANPNANNYKFSNGQTIVADEVYYFKVEPIKWRILVQLDGAFTLLTDMIIDSQPFNTSTVDRTIDGKTIYPNNYEHSSIRAWLNDDFYNKAFSTIDQSIIQTSYVDNGATTVDSKFVNFISEDTEDKVYLLSYNDADSIYFNSDAKRKAALTDYILAQNSFSAPENIGTWWTRSPFSTAKIASSVDTEGRVRSLIVSNANRGGVRPALQIIIDLDVE